MKNVVLGFLGTKLDSHGGAREKRHSIWRPTIALCDLPDLKFDRLELWFDRSQSALADRVSKDVAQLKAAPQIKYNYSAIRDPWNFEEVYSFLYDYAENYPFDTEHENYFVHITTGTHVAQICLFLLCESLHIPAKLIQTAPPRDSSPESHSLIDLNLARYDKIAQRFEKKSRDNLTFLKSGIKTKNTAFNNLIQEIELVSGASREAILLMGPTGAGKSQLARKIYDLKKQKHALKGEFVELNCATLRGEQAMSTLFGHCKGAFTGAVNARDGVLKRADRGLLFLDEIAELGADEQAMLLSAIEEKHFLPVGGDTQEISDFQLIAGTNCDLQQAVVQKRFREDLLARINTWSFRLPPLAERREDIEPNLDYELQKFELRNERKVTFSEEAKDQYLEFALSREAIWKGNFRDLNSSVIRMATLASGGRITGAEVNSEIERLKQNWSNNVADSNTEDIGILKDAGLDSSSLDLFDRVQVVEVLRVLRDARSLSEAGRKLFSVSRLKKQKSNDADRLRKFLVSFGVNPVEIIKS